MLRREFGLLSLGSLFAAAVGMSANAASTHNITYKHVNLKDATSVFTLINKDSEKKTNIWNNQHEEMIKYLEKYKKYSKNIVCYVDERNNKYSICTLRDEEFTNKYIIYRPYQWQWVNSWGTQWGQL